MMQKGTLGLTLQQLRNQADQVLAAARVMGLRNGNGRFTPHQLLALFETLRVPAPANIYQVLGRLKSDELLMKLDGGKAWAITPLGKQQSIKNVGELNMVSLEIELRGTPGSEFGNAHHTVIDPSFAPVKWKSGIANLLKEYPFEKNVFLMTRFPVEEDDTAYFDPIRSVVPALRDTLDQHGLTLHLASDRQIDDSLLGNVAAHMWACQFGIGILEDRIDRGLNYNVITELGAMLMTGRRCALLKDQSVPRLPTDISGLIYKDIDLDKVPNVVDASHAWIANDLGLGPCPDCTQG